MWNKDLEVLFRIRKEDDSPESSSPDQRRKRCRSVLSSEDDSNSATERMSVARDRLFVLPATFDSQLRLELSPVFQLASETTLRNLLLHHLSYNGMSVLHHSAFLGLSATCEFILSSWEERKSLSRDRSDPGTSSNSSSKRLPSPEMRNARPPLSSPTVPSALIRGDLDALTLPSVVVTPNPSTATSMALPTTSTSTSSATSVPTAFSMLGTTATSASATTATSSSSSPPKSSLRTSGGYGGGGGSGSGSGSGNGPNLSAPILLKPSSRRFHTLSSNRHSVGISSGLTSLLKSAAIAESTTVWVPVIDCRDVNGRTPLHIAARLGNRALVATFLCHRASPAYVVAALAIMLAVARDL